MNKNNSNLRSKNELKNKNGKTEDVTCANEFNIDASKTTATGTVAYCSKLNIRKEPSLNSEILCEVSTFSKLKILLDKSADDWFCVSMKNGIEGFCMKKYVSFM